MISGGQPQSETRESGHGQLLPSFPGWSSFLAVPSFFCQESVSRCDMASKTDSDVESDDEFEELMSAQLRKFDSSREDSLEFKCKFIDVVDELQNQLRKRRLDRVEELLGLFFPISYGNSVLGLLATKFQSELEPIAQDSDPEALRFVLRWCAERFTSKWKERALIATLLYHDMEDVDALRELVGEPFFTEAAAQAKEGVLSVHPERAEPCSDLFWASLRGELHTVRRLLAEGASIGTRFWQNIPREVFTPARAAAERGHTAVAIALLASSPEKALGGVRIRPIANTCIRIMDQHLLDVLEIARNRNNIALATAVISALDTSFFLENYSMNDDLVVRTCVDGTPEFFQAALSAVRNRLHQAGQRLDHEWLTGALSDAIFYHKRGHVEVLLDEIGREKSGFSDRASLPCQMIEVLHSRSVSILRMLLVRYPEASICDEECDPVAVLQDYSWPAGARLLLEAGAVVKCTVPPQYANLLALSLEDRCRIAARRCIKPPLYRSVHLLPLPAKVKQRFLYKHPK